MHIKKYHKTKYQCFKMKKDKIKFIPCTDEDMLKKDIARANRKRTNTKRIHKWYKHIQ